MGVHQVSIQLTLTTALARGTTNMGSSSSELKGVPGDAALLVDLANPRTVPATWPKVVEAPVVGDQLNEKSAGRWKMAKWNPRVQSFPEFLEWVGGSR